MGLQLPEPDSLNSLLKNLVGDSPGVAREDGGPSIADVDAFVSVLVDDGGEPIGAILADLTAAISLGGQLVMLPKPGLEDQIEDGEPNELVVDAVSEVFNNITTVLNTIEGNPHVRSTKAERSSEAGDAGAWFASAASRGDYAGTFLCGAGRIILLER